MMPFSELIKSDKPVLVDFYADWCGPCKVMSPILQEVKSNLTYATIVKIDIDKNQKTAERFNIMAVPTLLLFKNGEVVWRQSGVIPSSKLEELIKYYS
jgi:thioredoxin 1